MLRLKRSRKRNDRKTPKRINNLTKNGKEVEKTNVENPQWDRRETEKNRRRASVRSSVLMLVTVRRETKPTAQRAPCSWHSGTGFHPAGQEGW